MDCASFFSFEQIINRCGHHSSSMSKTGSCEATADGLPAGFTNCEECLNTSFFASKKEQKSESSTLCSLNLLFIYASSIALPISFLLYLLAKSIHSVALYEFALASFKSEPRAVTPRTRPPLVTILSPLNLVPAWNT